MGARKKTGSSLSAPTRAGEGDPLGREDAKYQDFIRFMLPLALTTVVYSVGGPILNGGMARLPQATQTLAAFTLAWGIVDFLSSPLSQVRQLGKTAMCSLCVETASQKPRTQTGITNQHTSTMF